MEQIYYTQCPVGYGLGASNGFQIKRLSAGYPVTGDFRHLGLRAYPGGGRTLAPPALRYRRDGKTVEVAWLSPRTNEYETERGFWGRPGGHFAHGLRLDDPELQAIRRWPAGLFDSPTWKRSDRQPTRGQPPDEITLSAAALAWPPEFAAVAALADGIDPDRLARLFAALALVVGKGQTLFLVAEPARLGPIVALLTFAFPEPLRGDLTFSTYHDRPEELPGYRIQGTTPLCRPNRAALTALGVVADLTTGTFEPKFEPPAWARTLAGWWTRHDEVDEADWSATDARTRSARRPEAVATLWSDAWLGPLFAYPQAQRDRSAPTDSATWHHLTTFTTWLGRSDLAEEWVRPRGPDWWLAAAPAAQADPEARAALLAHLALRDAWRVAAQHAPWGDAVAVWFRDVDPVERDDAVARALRLTPRSALPSFARSLLRGLTPEGGAAALERLRADQSFDPATLLPLEASAAVAAILAGADGASLRAIVAEAADRAGATSAVLDAVEAGLVDHPESLADLAGVVASAFDPEGPSGGREGLPWALRRGATAADWLRPSLRPLLADPGRIDTWRSLAGLVPEEARPSLATVVLRVAADPGLPPEAFRWAVEELLLPMAPRPHDPAWPETYLQRMPSGLDLLHRLFWPKWKPLRILAWIDRAEARGELSPASVTRVVHCKEFARTLGSRDAERLQAVDVPNVPPEERGTLLREMLGRVGGDRLEGLPFVLDACRGAWAGAFTPGAPGLASLAEPLARGFANLSPDRWTGRVAEIAERLGVASGPLGGFEPEGLAAAMMAATAANQAEPARWSLRQHLLRDAKAWRILAADIRRELSPEPPGSAPDLFERWDRKLSQEKPERLFEIFLNACDGPRLAAVAIERAPDLRTLPALSWWAHVRHAGATDDLRDAYARTAPLAPLAPGQLSPVRNWVAGPARGPFRPTEPAPPGLSVPGWARWLCLEAITDFRHVGADAAARWPTVKRWEADLPLVLIPVDDRYRFVAWLIEGLESHEWTQLESLAEWLARAGLDDPGRLSRWTVEIAGLAEVADDAVVLRLALVGELEKQLTARIRPTRGSGRPGKARP